MPDISGYSLQEAEDYLYPRYNKFNHPSPQEQPMNGTHRNYQDGILQALLGREGQPTLAPIPAGPPKEKLYAEIELARQSGDMERVRTLNSMLERTNQAAGLTSAEQLGPPQQEPQGWGPFRALNKVLGGGR